MPWRSELAAQIIRLASNEGTQQSSSSQTGKDSIGSELMDPNNDKFWERKHLWDV
jgi:hypothetical protein